MKKFLASITAFLIAITMTMPVMAKEETPERVVDGADILTDTEESKLLKIVDEISERQDFDIVILTADGIGNNDAEAFAEDFYDYNGYKADGIIFFIDMNERDWVISACGYGIEAFTDAGRDYISEQVIDDLKAGNYYDTFVTFAKLCDEFINQADNGDPYDVGNLPKGSFPALKYIVVALIVGFVISGIINLSLRAQLKSVRPNNQAADYVIPGSMNVTGRNDMFLYRKVTSVRKAESSSGGRGGSTTHHSSSGRTHSSSRGKF